MPFLIDGILASEHLDSSGESLSIAGCDLSSIHRGEGIVNFEHKSESPLQCLGKIISAKKIYSEKDTENERELHFWNKCKCPYIYIVCELFDSEVGKHVASMFQYAEQNKDKSSNPSNVLGFSIEGSKLNKVGPIIKACIARKATLTALPCNKSCIAEMLPAQPVKDDSDSIFKSEPSYTIELLGKSELLAKAQVPGSKHPPAAQVKPSIKPPSTGMKYGPMESKPKDLGKEIGKTKSGKSVMSHAKPTDYKDFSSQEHQEAANIHMGHAEEGKGVPGASHFDTAKRHMALAGRGERQNAQVKAARQAAVNKSEKLKKVDMSTPPPEPSASGAAAMQSGAMSGGTSFGQAMTNIKTGLGFGKKEKPKKELIKALGAGSGMVGPGNLVQGAALGKESVDKKMKKFEDPLKSTVAGDRIKRAAGYKERGDKLSHTIAMEGAKEAHKEKLSNIKAAPKPKLGKSEWLARAEKEYQTWSKREEFENFMAKSMPHLSKGEIKAIGQTLALNKSLRNEKKLAKMMAPRANLHSFVEKKEKK